MRIGKYSIIKTIKLENQEREFEAKLEAERSIWLQSNETWERMYDELLEKYKNNLQTLEISQANEVLLNEQTFKLNKKLLEATSLSFPDKRFNIKKAIELLTKMISDKTLASFLRLLVEELSKTKVSHMQSLQRYVEQFKISENGK